MFCKNCGTEISESQKFCPKCGEKNQVNKILNEQNLTNTYVRYSITDKGKKTGYLICVVGFLYIICIGAFIGLSDSLDNIYKFALAALCLGGAYLIIIGAFVQRKFVCIYNDKVIMNQGLILGKNIEFVYNEIINIAVFNNTISFDTTKGKIIIKNIENAAECCNLIKNRVLEK